MSTERAQWLDVADGGTRLAMAGTECAQRLRRFTGIERAQRLADGQGFCHCATE